MQEARLGRSTCFFEFRMSPGFVWSRLMTEHPPELSRTHPCRTDRMAIPVFPARYAFPKGSVAVNITSRLFSRLRTESSPFPRVGSTTVPRYQPEVVFGATIVLLRDVRRPSANKCTKVRKDMFPRAWRAHKLHQRPRGRL